MKQQRRQKFTTVEQVVDYLKTHPAPQEEKLIRSRMAVARNRESYELAIMYETALYRWEILKGMRQRRYIRN